MANLELRTKAVKQISDTLSKLLVLFSRKCEGQSRSAVVEDHSVTVITGSIQCPPVSETETKKTELVISMAKPEPFSQFAQYSMVMSRNTRSPNFLAQFRADKSSDRCHSIFPSRENKKKNCLHVQLQVIECPLHTPYTWRAIKASSNSIDIDKMTWEGTTEACFSSEMQEDELGNTAKMGNAARSE